MRLISDYIDIFENPEGFFSTLKAEDIEICRDNYKQIRLYSGGNACVFQIKFKGKPAMLKCYIAEPAFLRERYEYLNSLQSPYIGNYKFLEGELCVPKFDGSVEYQDIVLGDWIQGESLSYEIKWATKTANTARLRQLSEKFDNLARYLLSQPCAHGDLKPQNIIVDKDDNLKLIDLDSIYCPMLKGKASNQLGTPSYQHPLRDKNFYNNHLDNYSLILISISLHCLSQRPELYKQYHAGDNIILEPREIFAGDSEIYNILCELYRKNTTFTKMLKLLKGENYKIKEIKQLFTKL